MSLSEVFLNFIYKSSPNPIVVLDAKLNVISVNNAYLAITEYKSEDLVGKKPLILESNLYERSFFKTKLKELRRFGFFEGDLWDKTKSGALILKSLKIRELRDKDDELLGYVEYFSDSTKLKNTEENLHKIKNYNQITGLPNRVLFESFLQISSNIAKIKNKKFGVVILNINRFKTINESMGFGVGNQILREAALRIKQCISGNNRIAHLGSDEFVFITKVIRDDDQITKQIKKLRDLFMEPFTVEGNDINISVSFGISKFPNDGKNPSDLIKNADAALRDGKQYHDQFYQFFNEDIENKVLRRRKIEDQIQVALKNKEFYLEFQPKITLSTGKICGTEALIRWKKDGVVIPPDQFISIAEETKQILEIGEWVFYESCYFAKKLLELGGEPIRVAINLSSHQLRQKNFITRIQSILNETGISAEYIEIELTERVIMESVEDNIVALNQLNDLGFHISIDDFGTGYSSLSYLKWFPIHSIKIDKSFIDLITESKDDQEISKAIIALAHSLNLEVVAEGVETKEQIEYLMKLNCDQIQGYYCSRPLKPEVFEEILQRNESLIT